MNIDKIYRLLEAIELCDNILYNKLKGDYYDFIEETRDKMLMELKQEQSKTRLETFETEWRK